MSYKVLSIRDMKKLHGFNTLDIMLPTGISYIYGQCAMRNIDKSIINLIQLDQYLVDIQNAYGDGWIRKVYGDRIFNLMETIMRAHVGDMLNPLTEQQTLENSGTKAVRITIENFFFYCS